jgi:hypothetical protein
MRNIRFPNRLRLVLCVLFSLPILSTGSVEIGERWLWFGIAFIVWLSIAIFFESTSGES